MQRIEFDFCTSCVSWKLWCGTKLSIVFVKKICAYTKTRPVSYQESSTLPPGLEQICLRNRC